MLAGTDCKHPHQAVSAQAMNVSIQRCVHVTVAGIKGKWRMDHANVRNVGGVEFAVILTRDRTLTTLLALLAERKAEIIGKKNINFGASDSVAQLLHLRNAHQETLVRGASAGSSLFADVEVDAAIETAEVEPPARKQWQRPPKIQPVDDVIVVPLPDGSSLRMQSVERRDAPLSIEMTPSNLAVFFDFVVQSGMAFLPKARPKRKRAHNYASATSDDSDHDGDKSDGARADGDAPGECDAESDAFQPLDEIPDDVET